MASMSGSTAQVAPIIKNDRRNLRGATSEPTVTATIACDKEDGTIASVWYTYRVTFNGKPPNHEPGPD
jgi:hypothetical protein